jgi:hypothetical protein
MGKFSCGNIPTGRQPRQWEAPRRWS